MAAALALSTPAHAADSDIPTWNGTEKEEAYAACLVGRTIIYFNRNPVIDQQEAMAKAKEDCGKEPDTLEGNARFDDFMAFAVGDWIAKKYLPGKDEPTPAHAAEFKPDPMTKITCLSSSERQRRSSNYYCQVRQEGPPENPFDGGHGASWLQANRDKASHR